MSADTTEFPWLVEAGERETLTFPILDGNGVAVAIPGWTVDAKIKTRPGGAVLYTFPTSAITVTTTVGSTVRLIIPASVSAAWTFTTGWYRVKVADDDPDDPNAFRVLAGPLIVDPD